MVKCNDLVSVVIPTFNRSNIISRAVDSVINQTYENWELLIVDDGSTDYTENVINQKYSNDTRINYIRRPNTRIKGASACRNIGAEKAEGKYVAFLDTDDEWLPEHLVSKIGKIKSTGFNFVFGSYVAKDINRSSIIECTPIDSGRVDFYLTSNGDIRTSTFVLKRTSFLSIKFDEKLAKHQDWDFALRFCQKYKYDVDEACTVNIYTRHEGRMSNNLNHSATERFLNRHKEYLQKRALENILKVIGFATFSKEKRSTYFMKYSRLLRKNGIISSKLSFTIAYIFPIPIVGYIFYMLITLLWRLRQN